LHSSDHAAHFIYGEKLMTAISDIARADRPEQAMFRPPAARLVVPINQPAQNILKSST